MMRLTHFFCLCILVLYTEAIPKQYHGISKPSNNKIEAKDRIPLDISPINYNLDITLPSEVLESKDGHGQFEGTVKIQFTVTKDDRKVIPLHAKNLAFNETHIKFDDIKFEFETDETNEMVKITCETALTKDTPYNLEIKYKATLNREEMYGFYQSSYKVDEETTEYLAVTQFEEMGARLAFPCFDEPHFKATFDISITHPLGYTALSNNAEIKLQPSKTVTKFKTTPKMSTYLVAFMVSKFTCDSETVDSNIVEICSRDGAKEARATALKVTPEAVKQMEKYTAVNYKDMSLDKLSEVALPDFEMGAMENWGMLTYREKAILLDETTASERDRQSVLNVITHEISHQWFGDKVTLDWWSDIFLNEGFATFFEYYASAKVETSWDLEKQFVIEQLQQVLLTDSYDTSLPLHSNVSDPEEIKNKFDDISYNKGGSIIRMLNFLFKDGFTPALTTYLSTKDALVTPESLYDAFEQYKNTTILGEKNVEDFLGNWITEAGYPLLTVEMTDLEGKTNITISQKRFLVSGKDEKDTKWIVPITYAIKTDDFSNTTIKQLLQKETPLNISLDEKVDWFILNNQQIGYYRVHYDDNSLAKISAALASKIDDIDEISRSELVDDQFNLARAGVRTLKDVLDFLKFLENDKSYYSWYSAMKGYGYLLQRISGDKTRTALKEHINKQINVFATDVKEAKDHVKILAKMFATTWTCALDYADCLKDASDKFQKYIEDSKSKPDANEAPVVYCYGLSQSEKPSDDYEFLWQKYQESKSSAEQVVILQALGCVKDSATLKKFLEATLTNDIRVQDVRYIFTSVLSHGGFDGLVEFIQNKTDDMVTRFGVDTVTSVIASLPDYVTTSSQSTKVGDIESHTENEDIKNAAKEAKTAADNNINITEDLEKTLKAFFGISSATTNTFMIFNVALVLGVYALFN